MKITKEEILMYIFNKITVNPQLPKRIGELLDIANNLWWSWNSEFLRLFKEIDSDLWETVGKNPVKFLKLVSQERLENVANNEAFLSKYDEVVQHFNAYMNTKETWFSKNYPSNTNDLIAPGIICATLGLAIGNFIGIGVGQLFLLLM